MVRMVRSYGWDGVVVAWTGHKGQHQDQPCSLYQNVPWLHPVLRLCRHQQDMGVGGWHGNSTLGMASWGWY